MSTATRTSDSLIGSVRELITQTERVARAEARATMSHVIDLAFASARRGSVLAVSLLFGVVAGNYAVFAGYLALSTRMEPWRAALVVAGALGAVAAVLGWLGLRGKSPLKSGLSDLAELRSTGRTA